MTRTLMMRIMSIPTGMIMIIPTGTGMIMTTTTGTAIRMGTTIPMTTLPRFPHTGTRAIPQHRRHCGRSRSRRG